MPQRPVTMADDGLGPLPEQYLRACVEAALQADQGGLARLVSVTSEPGANKGDNYATLVARLKVTFTLARDTRHVTYFAKYDPRRMKAFKSYTVQLFRKEVMFYDHILVDLQEQLRKLGVDKLSCPSMFFASDVEGKEILMLEDLSPKGFKMMDVHAGLDVAHTTLALRELAKLHATSYLLKQTTPDLTSKYPKLAINWFNYDASANATAQTVFGNNMANAAAVLRDVGGFDVAVGWLERNKDNAADIMKKHARVDTPFEVICHGDCWSNNMMFRYEEEVPVEVALLDLQLVRQASLATDLAYFLYTSLDPDVRRQNLDHFLELYLDAFRQVVEGGGVRQPFTLQELQQEYHRRLEFGLIRVTFVLILMVGRNVSATDQEEDTGKVSEGLKEALTKGMSDNKILRNRYLSLFEEMMEKGIVY